MVAAARGRRALSGRRLCRLDEIEDGAARGFAHGEGPGLFVVRQGEKVYGYVNDCPHWRITLNILPDRFMNRGKGLIQCANHGARFTVETGECVFGPCQGDSLTPVAVLVIDGHVVLTE